ncbi:MAG: 2-phospho-L-lactate transferase [Anaerolineaceae bacterium]|nr:2-phospho-L-lactate transferase [Anaerolineaceae bacterium]
MNVVALAGGVGGAKLADGLARALPPSDLTLVVNTGDDFEHLRLRISPDLDTVCYTLAGLANPDTGWGQKDETWHALESLAKLGGPRWFGLGDRDLGTHLERTRRLAEGEPLSRITHDFCITWGINQRVLPMTDDRVATMVLTRDLGDLPFQSYFVEKRCEPEVTGFRFDGIAEAKPAPGVIEAIQDADLVVICPSNPWVSIRPILSLSGVEESLKDRPVVAVSPIIGGKAVKGPAAKMYSELGIQPSALAVAHHYGNLLTGFILDQTDEHFINEIGQSGIIAYATDTLMLTADDRYCLAKDVLDFFEDRLRRNPNQ